MRRFGKLSLTVAVVCLLLAGLGACAKDLQVKPKGQIQTGVSVGR